MIFNKERVEISLPLFRTISLSGAYNALGRLLLRALLCLLMSSTKAVWGCRDRDLLIGDIMTAPPTGPAPK